MDPLAGSMTAALQHGALAVPQALLSWFPTDQVVGGATWLHTWAPDGQLQQHRVAISGRGSHRQLRAAGLAAALGVGEGCAVRLRRQRVLAVGSGEVEVAVVAEAEGAGGRTPGGNPLLRGSLAGVGDEGSSPGPVQGGGSVALAVAAPLARATAAAPGGLTQGGRASPGPSQNGGRGGPGTASKSAVAAAGRQHQQEQEEEQQQQQTQVDEQEEGSRRAAKRRRVQHPVLSCRGSNRGGSAEVAGGGVAGAGGAGEMEAELGMITESEDAGVVERGMGAKGPGGACAGQSTPLCGDAGVDGGGEGQRGQLGDRGDAEGTDNGGDGEDGGEDGDQQQEEEEHCGVEAAVAAGNRGALRFVVPHSGREGMPLRREVVAQLWPDLAAAHRPDSDTDAAVVVVCVAAPASASAPAPLTPQYNQEQQQEQEQQLPSSHSHDRQQPASPQPQLAYSNLRLVAPEDVRDGRVEWRLRGTRALWDRLQASSGPRRGAGSATDGDAALQLSRLLAERGGVPAEGIASGVQFPLGPPGAPHGSTCGTPCLGLEPQAGEERAVGGEEDGEGKVECNADGVVVRHSCACYRSYIDVRKMVVAALWPEAAAARRPGVDFRVPVVVHVLVHVEAQVAQPVGVSVSRPAVHGEEGDEKQQQQQQLVPFPLRLHCKGEGCGSHRGCWQLFGATQMLRLLRRITGGQGAQQGEAGQEAKAEQGAGETDGRLRVLLFQLRDGWVVAEGDLEEPCAVRDAGSKGQPRSASVKRSRDEGAGEEEEEAGERPVRRLAGQPSLPDAGAAAGSGARATAAQAGEGGAAAVALVQAEEQQQQGQRHDREPGTEQQVPDAAEHSGHQDRDDVGQMPDTAGDGAAAPTASRVAAGDGAQQESSGVEEAPDAADVGAAPVPATVAAYAPGSSSPGDARKLLAAMMRARTAAGQAKAAAPCGPPPGRLAAAAAAEAGWARTGAEGAGAARAGAAPAGAEAAAAAVAHSALAAPPAAKVGPWVALSPSAQGEREGGCGAALPFQLPGAGQVEETSEAAAGEPPGAREVAGPGAGMGPQGASLLQSAGAPPLPLASPPQQLQPQPQQQPQAWAAGALRYHAFVKDGTLVPMRDSVCILFPEQWKAAMAGARKQQVELYAACQGPRRTAQPGAQQQRQEAPREQQQQRQQLVRFSAQLVHGSRGFVVSRAGLLLQALGVGYRGTLSLVALPGGRVLVCARGAPLPHVHLEPCVQGQEQHEDREEEQQEPEPEQEQEQEETGQPLHHAARMRQQRDGKRQGVRLQRHRCASPAHTRAPPHEAPDQQPKQQDQEQKRTRRRQRQREEDVEQQQQGQGQPSQGQEEQQQELPTQPHEQQQVQGHQQASVVVRPSPRHPPSPRHTPPQHALRRQEPGALLGDSGGGSGSGSDGGSDSDRFGSRGSRGGGAGTASEQEVRGGQGGSEGGDAGPPLDSNCALHYNAIDVRATTARAVWPDMFAQWSNARARARGAAGGRRRRSRGGDGDRQGSGGGGGDGGGGGGGGSDGGVGGDDGGSGDDSDRGGDTASCGGGDGSGSDAVGSAGGDGAGGGGEGGGATPRGLQFPVTVHVRLQPEAPPAVRSAGEGTGRGQGAQQQQQLLAFRMRLGIRQWHKGGRWALYGSISKIRQALKLEPGVTARAVLHRDGEGRAVLQLAAVSQGQGGDDQVGDSASGVPDPPLHVRREANSLAMRSRAVWRHWPHVAHAGEAGEAAAVGPDAWMGLPQLLVVMARPGPGGTRGEGAGAPGAGQPGVGSQDGSDGEGRAAGGDVQDGRAGPSRVSGPLVAYELAVEYFRKTTEWQLSGAYRLTAETRMGRRARARLHRLANGCYRFEVCGEGEGEEQEQGPAAAMQAAQGREEGWGGPPAVFHPYSNGCVLRGRQLRVRVDAVRRLWPQQAADVLARQGGQERQGELGGAQGGAEQQSRRQRSEQPSAAAACPSPGLAAVAMVQLHVPRQGAVATSDGGCRAAVVRLQQLVDSEGQEGQEGSEGQEGQGQGQEQQGCLERFELELRYSNPRSMVLVGAGELVRRLGLRPSSRGTVARLRDGRVVLLPEERGWERGLSRWRGHGPQRRGQDCLSPQERMARVANCSSVGQAISLRIGALAVLRAQQQGQQQGQQQQEQQQQEQERDGDTVEVVVHAVPIGVRLGPAGPAGLEALVRELEGRGQQLKRYMLRHNDLAFKPRLYGAGGLLRDLAMANKAHALLSRLSDGRVLFMRLDLADFEGRAAAGEQQQQQQGQQQQGHVDQGAGAGGRGGHGGESAELSGFEDSQSERGSGDEGCGGDWDGAGSGSESWGGSGEGSRAEGSRGADSEGGSFSVAQLGERKLGKAHVGLGVTAARARREREQEHQWWRVAEGEAADIAGPQGQGQGPCLGVGAPLSAAAAERRADQAGANAAAGAGIGARPWAGPGAAAAAAQPAGSAAGGAPCRAAAGVGVGAAGILDASYWQQRVRQLGAGAGGGACAGPTAGVAGGGRRLATLGALPQLPLPLRQQQPAGAAMGAVGARAPAAPAAGLLRHLRAASHQPQKPAQQRQRQQQNAPQ